MEKVKISLPDNIDLENPEFQNAWKLLQYTHRSVFLTGKAGTGKSTFLKYICANTRKKYVVLAPTGIAAVNVGGQTIHSFFKLPFKPLLPDDPEFARNFKQRMKYSKEHQKLIKSLQLIIIDEISMVRADIIDFVDRILRVYSGNSREPFGGKQLLLVGDIFQLEPVVTPDMRDILSRYYTNPYFFSARALTQLQMVSVELRKIYRQNDTEFIQMLDRIRIGKPTVDDMRCINSRVADNRSDSNSSGMIMTLATRRDMVDSINSHRLNELKSPSVVYEGEIHGDFPEAALPNTMRLELKVGAQVVFIKNHPLQLWVNGTIGRVHIANTDKLVVETEDGTIHDVPLAIWSNIRYRYDEKKKRIEEEELGTFIQYPVKLAWALTIHKSQGLTFSNVNIDVGTGTFSSGQTYVALSRCRSIEGLKLISSINARDVFVNPSIVKFSQSFNNPRLISAALEQARADDSYVGALTKLRNGNLTESFQLFINAIHLRDETANKLYMRFARRELSKAPLANKATDKVKKQLADANKALSEAKAKFLTLASQYCMLANECYGEGMDPTPAIANYDKALWLVPDYEPAVLGKARLYMGEQMYDDVAATLQPLINKQPNAIEALLMLASASFAAGDAIKALDYAFRAYAVDKENPDTHFLLAQIYSKSGDKETAAYHKELAKKYRNKNHSGKTEK
ncbi:MAG: AAA family ATPase [Muribaculum sp.]|nr:AAA family ATPase [Muribaculaceae bacterium]MCM1081400.1 AAA family ATPase [Muribaculum sp.]